MPRMRRAAVCALALGLALSACSPSDTTRLEPDTGTTVTSAAPDRQPVVAEDTDRAAAQGPAASIVSPPAPVTTSSAPRSTGDSGSGGSSGGSCDVGRAAAATRSSSSTARVRGPRSAPARASPTAPTSPTWVRSAATWSTGVTSASSKREGDGHTPAGVYPLRGGFGAKGDPGLPQGWFTVDGNDYWVDDPDSALYNTHQRGPADGRWDSAGTCSPSRRTTTRR